jgi:hypothetical protein
MGLVIAVSAVVAVISGLVALIGHDTHLNPDRDYHAETAEVDR